MKLYKNVDICDLANILENGILPMSETGNDNWVSGKRANNSEAVVYLFSPIGKKVNSFPKYGVVLLEVDIPDTQVKKNDMSVTDAHISDYVEYVTGSVSPEYISAAYIPKIFKGQLDLETEKINFVEISAEVYSCEKADEIKTDFFKKLGYEPTFWPDDLIEKVRSEAYIPASAEKLAALALTNVCCSNNYNFLRATINKEMVDFYNFHYFIRKEVEK